MSRFPVDNESGRGGRPPRVGDFLSHSEKNSPNATRAHPAAPLIEPFVGREAAR